MDRADFTPGVSKSLTNRRQVSRQILTMRGRIEGVDVLCDLLCECIHEVVVLHRNAEQLKQTCSARLYEKKVVNVPEKERWQIYPRALNSCHDPVRHATRHTRELLSDDPYRPIPLCLHGEKLRIYTDDDATRLQAISGSRGSYLNVPDFVSGDSTDQGCDNR